MRNIIDLKRIMDGGSTLSGTFKIVVLGEGKYSI